MKSRILSKLDNHASGLKLAPRLTIKQAEQVSSDIAEARAVMAELIEALELLVSKPLRIVGNRIEIDTESHMGALYIVTKATEAIAKAKGESK